PPAHPPRRLARSRRAAAGHRRDADPAAGRLPARRPRPEAGVAVVVRHRRRAGRRGPVLAAAPAQIRPGAHLPLLQAGPGLDLAEGPRSGGRGPVDLADHRRLRPAAPGPPAGRRPAPPLGTAIPAGTADSGPGPPGVPERPREGPLPSR